MRILIADDDRKFLDFAQRALSERTDYEVSVVNDGLQALQYTLREQPDVLVLDWLMPSMNGTQVCRLVRAQSRNPDIFVLFVTSRGRREEMIECLNAGGDDLLIKPVPPDLLVARLDMARQRAGGPEDYAARMRLALLDAAAQRDGEFVARSGALSARVFFHDGKVAWTQLADGSGTFLQALALKFGLDADTVASVLEECRTSGQPLTDTIVSWGLVDREQLLHELKLWMTDKIHRVIRLPQARSMFLPQRRDYADSVLFALDELGIVEPAPTAGLSERDMRPSMIPMKGWDRAFVMAPQTNASIDRILEACIAQGVTGVVALEMSSGYCLGKRGAELNADAAWAHIRCLNAVMRLGKVEDSIVTTDGAYHLARVLPHHGDTFVYAVVDARSANLALARRRLQEAIEPSTHALKA